MAKKKAKRAHRPTVATVRRLTELVQGLKGACATAREAKDAALASSREHAGRVLELRAGLDVTTSERDALAKALGENKVTHAREIARLLEQRDPARVVLRLKGVRVEIESADELTG